MPIVNPGSSSSNGQQWQQKQATIATEEIGTNAQSLVLLPIGFSVIYRIKFFNPTRLRLYSSTADRDSDQARPVANNPSAGAGLLLELVGNADLDFNLSPLVWIPSADGIPATITNLSTSTSINFSIYYWGI
ncbi:MAG TPA: hypothetical protein V6D10_05810 [Trichocoleus sp.]|jgi:hypothetical protein